MKKIIRWFEKNKIISWSIVIIIAIFIFYISSLSFEKGAPGPDFPLKSYVYHFGIFFLFSFFLSISIVQGKYKNLILIVILVGIFYGMSDEFHQLFVPNRSCTFNDFVTDSVGVLSAGVFYLSLINNRIKKKSKPHPTSF